MIASPAAHRERKSLKNLSSMPKAVLELFSCEKTKLHGSHSAARKPFAKGFSKERHYEDCEHSVNGHCDGGAVRRCYTGTRGVSKTPNPGGSPVACAIPQPRVETGRFGDPQAARSL